MTQLTETSRKEFGDLREAINRSLRVIEIFSLTDDGEEISRVFANEAAAQEYEHRMARRQVPTRRGA